MLASSAYEALTLVDTMWGINKQEIVAYIEARHLSDGGYFFARIGPSSGLETCLAVKTLNLLGVEVKNAGSVLSFWQNQAAKGNLDNLLAVYLMVETYKELNVPFDCTKKAACRILDRTKDALIHPPRIKKTLSKAETELAGAMNYVSLIGRDLENLYYYVRLSHDLDIPLDTNTIVGHVQPFRNADGGFGHEDCSDPMVTFHALGIMKTVSHSIESPRKLKSYLHSQLACLDYLERLYFVVKAMALIDEPLQEVGKIREFIEGCYRKRGGFGRARSMGIATIEYTFMASSVLQYCDRT